MVMMDEGVFLSSIWRRETLLLLYRGERLPDPPSRSIITHHHQLYIPYTLCNRCTLGIRYLLYILYVLYRWWGRMMMDDDDGWRSLSPRHTEERHSVWCIEERLSVIHHHPPSPTTTTIDIPHILSVLDVLYVYLVYSIYTLCTL